MNTDLSTIDITHLTSHNFQSICIPSYFNQLCSPMNSFPHLIPSYYLQPTVNTSLFESESKLRFIFYMFKLDSL